MSAKYTKATPEQLQQHRIGIMQMRAFGGIVPVTKKGIANFKEAQAKSGGGLAASAQERAEFAKKLADLGVSIDKYAAAFGESSDTMLEVMVCSARERNRDLDEFANEALQEIVLFGIPAFDGDAPSMEDLGLESLSDRVAGLQLSGRPSCCGGACKSKKNKQPRDLKGLLDELVDKTKNIDPALLEQRIAELERITGMSREELEAKATEKAEQAAEAVDKAIPALRSALNSLSDLAKGIRIAAQVRKMQKALEEQMKQFEIPPFAADAQDGTGAAEQERDESADTADVPEQDDGDQPAA